MNYLFVNNLTVIDFSYFDAKRGIVGESWIVDIELGGELDEQGMVFDFGLVKKTIKNLIDEEVDHRFVVSEHEKNFEKSSVEEETILKWHSANAQYEHHSPETAIVILKNKVVNKDNIAQYLEQKILEVLPQNVTSVKLHLHEERIRGAYYHYSHGLKKHDGNCQRIVHGHRSKIEIFQNHSRNQELEDLWASSFHNIYIATREDLIETRSINGKPHCEFGYQANQGKFKLVMPADSVYFIDTDSTVEWIAAHIADQCHAKYPETHIKVRAFEGVGKGAIAVRENDH